MTRKAIEIRTADATCEGFLYQPAANGRWPGGGLYTDAPNSPHKVLPRVKARLYFGHATNEHSTRAEAIEKFEQALAASGRKYESETYDAPHGWSVPGGPKYREPEAEKAFRKLTELLPPFLK
jgi:carboxymethylenebutenolidase